MNENTEGLPGGTVCQKDYRVTCTSRAPLIFLFIWHLKNNLLYARGNAAGLVEPTGCDCLNINWDSNV